MSNNALRAAPAVSGGVLAVAAIGLIMSQQSVSVASGSTVVWIGAALTVLAAAAAFVIPHVPDFVKALAIIAVVIAVSSAFRVEHQLDQKRHQIEQILNTIPTAAGTLDYGMATRSR